MVKIGALPNVTPTSKRSKAPHCMGGAGRIFQNRPKKTKIHYTCQLRVYLRKLMQSMLSLESARKPKTLRCSTQTADLVYMRAFTHHFFVINLSPDLGYEAPRRGPLLWPVIHSVQSSPTPSLSSCRSLTPNGSESVSSQYQDILGLLLKIEVRA